MRTKELEAIVEEEADIFGDEPSAGSASTVSALHRVLDKLREKNYTFTPIEKSAIKYALQDVGELYLFAGTTAGFDVENVKQMEECKNLGSLARVQAHQLNINV